MITVQIDRNLTIVSLLLQVSPVGSPAVSPPQGIARKRGGAVAGSGRGNTTAVKGRGRSAASLNLLLLARSLLAQPTRTCV